LNAGSMEKSSCLSDMSIAPAAMGTPKPFGLRLREGFDVSAVALN
jgi:hypothetical protein